MELEDVQKISYDELAAYTDNFCENNFICHFQFGQVYRGEIEHAGQTQYVMVKIWEVPEIYEYLPGDNERRLMDEIILLSHEISSHPGMLKLYGYCYEDDFLGVVYEFKPFESVFYLIPEDDFTWLQRIKVAIGFASLLKYLHTVKGSLYKPFIVRNLDCAHIVLDEDYNPKLCDFSMITGGIFPDRTIYTCYHVLGCYGYIDCHTFRKGDYSVKQDVFAFGAILVNLISKRVYDAEDIRTSAPEICKWSWEQFANYEYEYTRSEQRTFSLVHESLASDPDFDPVDGRKIFLLAKECMCSWGHERPTMKQVLRSLLKLRIVKKHADFLGVNKLRRS